MLNLKGKNAICVGATSGIGRAVAIRLAELQANVTVVGRNAQVGSEVLQELTKANPAGEHSFVTVDASSMKSIVKGCDAYLAANKDKPLHYCVMTQGVAVMSGRSETSEGIDNKMALHYYGRALFLRQLGDRMKQTALQKSNHDVRVLNIFSGGVHGVYKDPTDLDLKKNYSLANAANATGFYNDLAMDALSRDNGYLQTAGLAGDKTRGISYIHAAPGMVDTPWGKDFPIYLTIPVRVLQKLFAKSPQQCAALMVDGMLSEGRTGQGFHIMGEKGQVAKVTDAHTDAYREIVWAHTNELIDRALAMN